MRFKDRDFRGYFLEFSLPRQFTVYGGVRYVHPLPIVVDREPTTTGSCQAVNAKRIIAPSITCEHKSVTVPDFCKS